MSQFIIAILAGGLFGAGLAVSGMADPQRVRGFLDVLGEWDATLAFVMGGALIPMAIAWRVQNRLMVPLAAPSFSLPTDRRIDPKLLGGATLFGVGWGIAGLCPGPAIADLAIAPVPSSIFVAAMLGGMVLHRLTFASERSTNQTRNVGRHAAPDPQQTSVGYSADREKRSL